MRPLVGIYKSLPDIECRNWEGGRTVSFLGIYVKERKKESKKERWFIFSTQRILNIQLNFWYSVDWYEREVYKLGSGDTEATERINKNT
jgi:hypothetical protein